MSLTFSRAAGGPDLTACNLALSQVRAAIEATHPDLAAKLGEVMAQLGQSRDPQTVVQGLEAVWSRALVEKKIRLPMDGVEDSEADQKKFAVETLSTVTAVRRSLLDFRSDPPAFEAAVAWFNGKLDELRNAKFSGKVPVLDDPKHRLDMTTDVVLGVGRALDALEPFLALGYLYPHSASNNVSLLLEFRARWVEPLKGTIYFEGAANLYDDWITARRACRGAVSGSNPSQYASPFGDRTDLLYTRR